MSAYSCSGASEVLTHITARTTQTSCIFRVKHKHVIPINPWTICETYQVNLSKSYRFGSVCECQTSPDRWWVYVTLAMSHELTSTLSSCNAGIICRGSGRLKNKDRSTDFRGTIMTMLIRRASNHSSFPVTVVGLAFVLHPCSEAINMPGLS